MGDQRQTTRFLILRTCRGEATAYDRTCHGTLLYSFIAVAPDELTARSRHELDPFIEQLKQLVAAHPTRAKWVFVPTHAVGLTIGERIALEGTNWLNLRFVTPLDIALRMGAPFLVERGINPSEDELGPALIMRLLLD